METKNTVEINAYLKPSCGWSRGVRAVLAKYELPYEDINIIASSSAYREMVHKSGQELSPCVEINGVMLADVSGEEVERYLLANKIATPVQAVVEVPIDRGCQGAEPVETGSWSVEKN